MFTIKVEKFQVLQRNGKSPPIKVTKQTYLPVRHKRVKTRLDGRES